MYTRFCTLDFNLIYQIECYYYLLPGHNPYKSQQCFLRHNKCKPCTCRCKYAENQTQYAINARPLALEYAFYLVRLFFHAHAPQLQIKIIDKIIESCVSYHLQSSLLGDGLAKGLGSEKAVAGSLQIKHLAATKPSLHDPTGEFVALPG